MTVLARSALVVLLALPLACSDSSESSGSGDTSPDQASDSGSDTDATSDAGTDPQPDTTEDLTTDTPDDTADTGVDTTDASDTGDEVCVSVALVDSWVLYVADDVSVGFSGLLTPAAASGYTQLTLLFDRYQPGPDIGSFDLGAGADANFGTCAHCAVLLGPDPAHAYFADRGTLVTNVDPYTQRLDATVSNLRLIEVDVDMFTRTSTPVPDGQCVVVEDFTVDEVFPPEGWTCASEAFADGETCNCECGAFDNDCGVAVICAPFDPECEPVDPLPSDCEEGEVCTVEPLNFSTACFETCDWLARETCSAGTCVYDFGVGDGDTCISGNQRIDDATFGETCETLLQGFCNVEEGFALGFCDTAVGNVCRPVCDAEEDCTEEGESCRRFFGTDGLGYCGPEPTDG